MPALRRRQDAEDGVDQPDEEHQGSGQQKLYFHAFPDGASQP